MEAADKGSESKAVRTICFGVVSCALLLGLIWYCFLRWSPREFDPKAWATANPEKRGEMVQDLLCRHPLKGMSRDEVLKLLGHPNGSEEHCYIYEIGRLGHSSMNPMAFSYRLQVTFDPQWLVRDVEILD